MVDAAGPPATPKKPVTDVHHGVKVVEITWGGERVCVPVRSTGREV